MKAYFAKNIFYSSNICYKVPVVNYYRKDIFLVTTIFYHEISAAVLSSIQCLMAFFGEYKLECMFIVKNKK
jgi:hypothetical protein